MKPTTDLFLDNSMLEVFTTCPRAAQFYTIFKRERAEPRPALQFGHALHKAFEVFFKTQDLNKALEAIFAEMRDAPPDWRTPDLAATVFSKWVNLHHPGFPQKLHHVELPFAVPLGSIESLNNGTFNIVWMGRIDAIIEYAEKLFILDHKTTSIFGANYFNDFIISQQMRGYVWAAQKLLKERIHGVVVNTLVVRKPTPTNKSIEFAIKPIVYDPETIDEWENNTMHIVADYISNVDRNFFPQHTKWCMGKFGQCQYFDVCSAPSSQAQLILGLDLYKDVSWSPINNQNPK